MTKIFLTIISIIFLFGALPSYSESYTHNVECLANAIYREANGEPLRGQYAVGQVIMNRIHYGWASTPCRVIHQHRGRHYQFGWMRYGYRSIPHDRREHFYRIAERLMDERTRVIPVSVLYFNNRPFRRHRYYGRIGHQLFYY